MYYSSQPKKLNYDFIRSVMAKAYFFILIGISIMQLDNNIKCNNNENEKKGNTDKIFFVPPVKPTPPILADKNKKIFLE